MATQIQASPVGGLSREKWREVLSLVFILLAALFFLALVSHSLNHQWIGSIGEQVAYFLELLVGQWVVYVLPLLLVLGAIHAFHGRTPFNPVRKGFAGFLIITSLCALLTLRYALSDAAETRHASFLAGGIIGNYLTNHQGLALAERCGPVGALLVLLVALIVGAMLTTDFLFVPLIQGGVERIRQLIARWRRTPQPVATLRFEREAGGNAFPVAAVDPHDERSAPMDEESAAEFLPREDIEIIGPTNDFEEAPPEAPKAKKKEKKVEPMPMVQTELDFNVDDFEPPSIDLLSSPPHVADPLDRSEVIQISGELEQALTDFGISARVVAVTQGPVVTRYELQPAPGVKVSRIVSLENDIALVLRAKSVRIQAPIPGKAAIGIEVPNRKVCPVYFKDLLTSEEFRSHPSPIAFAVGKNISGEPVICDLAEMPHLLIAGTTGSGKSVCINVIISSILYRMPPDKVKFIMIDPKRVELNVYSDIPYLLAPVVNEPRQAAAGLAWAVGEMEQRLQLFSELKVRNINSYNDLLSGKLGRRSDRTDLKPLPHIVIIIDELADLMIIAKNEVEEFVIRLAQMSRAAGIHMIIATQRPSVNVITGIIKANFPSRIAFRVSAKVDSRTILDMNGAETLLGRGDMLFSPGGVKPMRVQGAFLSDNDVEHLTNHLRSQNPVVYEQPEFATSSASGSLEERGEATGDGDPEENRPVVVRRTAPVFGPGSSSDGAAKSSGVQFPSIPLKDDGEDDEDLYDRALRMVLESRKPSVSMIQRRLKIGFARAGRLMDLMEERGIVGPYLGSKPRDLIVEPGELLRRLDEMDRERG